MARIHSLCLGGLASAVFLAVSGQLQALSPRGTVCLEMPEVQEPATGQSQRFQIESLLQLSANRALVLLRSFTMRPDRWAGEPTAQERRAAEAGEKPLPGRFQVEAALQLAVVGKDGKLVKRSQPLPEPPGSPAGTEELLANKHCLLAAEDWTGCAYAVLLADPPRLLCYDLQLSLVKTIELPLQRASGGVAVPQGASAALYVVGQQRPRGNPVAAANTGQGRAAPPTSLAIASVSEEGKTNLHELRGLDGKLAQVAKDHRGARAALAAQASFAQLFSDATPGLPLSLLVANRIRAAEGGGEELAFFELSWTPQGLGGIRQLPFWVLFEDRYPAEVDKDAGVLRLPAGARVGQVAALSLPGGKKQLYLMLEMPSSHAVAEGRTEPGKPAADSFDVLQTLVGFTGKSTAFIELLDDHALQDPSLLEALRTSSGYVVPIRFMSRFDERTLAFHALLVGKGRAGASGPCAALLEASQ